MHVALLGLIEFAAISKTSAGVVLKSELIGEIFSRAARTVAYLGESSDIPKDKDKHSAFALMNMLLRILYHDQEHVLRLEDDWNAL